LSLFSIKALVKMKINSKSLISFKFNVNSIQHIFQRDFKKINKIKSWKFNEHEFRKIYFFHFDKNLVKKKIKKNSANYDFLMFYFYVYETNNKNIK
jgi:hypothetical protein